MSGIKGANAGAKNWRYKHGETNTRLFRVWSHMRERCERKNHPYYRDYGGRGISVCEEWKEYLPFKEWAIKSGYSERLTIDRIDYNKGYEPSNCRWATVKEQQNNKRTNRVVEYNGKPYTLSQLSELCGIKSTTLRERLRRKWSVDDAVTKPVRLRTKGYRQSSRMQTVTDCHTLEEGER